VVTESASSQWSALLALQRAAHSTVHLLTDQLADLGLTGSDINALANLGSGSGHTVSELAVAAGVRPTTMTSVLDRLEHRGLISRGSVPGDRRAVLVELTPSGRRVASVIRRSITSLERRALSGLPADAIAGLRAGLTAMAEVSP
jgi:DNA-binding MarR family transcriptional regulator